MDDSLRGSGLFKADQALAALVNDPERLERERARFDRSPPAYRSEPSGTTTRSQSTNPRSEAQLLRDERKWQLRLEHEASLPCCQFRDQYLEELDRLCALRTYELPPGMPDIDKHADSNVRQRWMEQGIWKDEWTGQFRPVGPWKHEEPPGPAESVAEREQLDREASRPFYQFMYQVSKERERIEEELNQPKAPTPPRWGLTKPLFGWPPPFLDRETGAQETRPAPESSAKQGATSTIPHDINTTAYERVKSVWIKRKIWNTKWGVLPGMSWKHEQPLEEFLREELGDDPVPNEPPKTEVTQPGPAEGQGWNVFGPGVPRPGAPSPEPSGDAATRGIFSLPNIFGPRSPAEPSHRPGAPSPEANGDAATRGTFSLPNIFGPRSPAEPSRRPGAPSPEANGDDSTRGTFSLPNIFGPHSPAEPNQRPCSPAPHLSMEVEEAPAAESPPSPSNKSVPSLPNPFLFPYDSAPPAAESPPSPSNKTIPSLPNPFLFPYNSAAENGSSSSTQPATSPAGRRTHPQRGTPQPAAQSTALKPVHPGRVSKPYKATRPAAVSKTKTPQEQPSESSSAANAHANANQPPKPPTELDMIAEQSQTQKTTADTPSPPPPPPSPPPPRRSQRLLHTAAAVEEAHAIAAVRDSARRRSSGSNGRRTTTMGAAAKPVGVTKGWR